MKFWLVRLGSLAAAVALCLLIDRVALTRDPFVQRLVLLAGLYVTLAVSLNLINGITGQFSIGHAAFYQVGAYTTAFLVTRFYGKGTLPFLGNLPPGGWLVVMILVSALTAAIAGLIVGLPSLRLRGDYLAIVTLGFGEIIRIVAQNQPAFGQAYGLNFEPRLRYIWLAWLLAILCIAVCRNLLKTAHGLPFLSVREDEVASSAMGVNVTRTKVTAFILGSAFAGAAGALFAHNEGYVSPDLFKMDVSFMIVTMVVLGGTGSITGSALAAVLLFYLPEKLRDVEAVPMSLLVGMAIALVASVAIIKRIEDRVHGPAIRRGGMILGVILAASAAAWLMGRALAGVPGLTGGVEGEKLRFVIFAVTLIVLMLLRPQGIFGHHEFSWSWVKRLFGRRNAPTTAVAT